MKKNNLIFMAIAMIILLFNLPNGISQTCNDLQNPYFMGFETNDANLVDWITIDGNNDGVSWGSSYPAHSGTQSYATSSPYNDDWLYTSCFTLSQAKSYKIIYWYKVISYGINYPQNLKFGIKNSLPSINDTVFSETLLDLKNISNYTTFNKASYLYTPTTNGNYYFGWFAYGYNGDGLILFLDDFSIEEFDCNNTVINLGADTTICNGSSIELDAGAGFVSYKWNNNSQLNTQILTTDTAGTFFVEATDEFNCTAKDTINISVSSFPNDSLIVENNYNRELINWQIDLCKDEDARLIAFLGDSLSKYDIKWYRNDYNIADGDTLIVNQDGRYNYTFEHKVLGCLGTSSDTVRVNVSYPYEGERISFVTVDSVSGKNMVVWDNTQTNLGISYVKVYKETNVSDVYSQIGSNVPYPADSSFIDNASNPQVKAERYKISIVDSCGNESAKSEAHKTIHLSIGLGINNSYNLMWDDYEGLYYTTFVINRDTSANMQNRQELARLQSSIMSYTDVQPIAGKVNYYSVYIIDTIKKSSKKHKILSSSNVVASKSVGINEWRIENGELRIYPNPAGEITNIKYQITNNSKITIKIYDLMGREVDIIENGKLKINKREHKISYDTKKLRNGVYLVRLVCDDGVRVGKFLKE